ncbi:MAG: two-component regulator propeller domain-containing protein [Bacteroidota bacterium]
MKKVLKYIFLTTLFVVAGFSLFAQSARFRQLSVDDGLAQNSVFAITQDMHGFVWIGTVDGLSKYDGHTFKNYHNNINDTTTISAGNITSLLAYDKSLWIGLREGGLNRIDLEKDKIYRYKTDTSGNGFLNSYTVLSLCLVGDKIYMGTLDGGVNILDTKTDKFTYIRSEKEKANSIQSDLVRSVVKDNNGKLWLGHPNAGVTCYDPITQKCRRFNGYDDGSGTFLNNEVIRAVFCDSKNRVWISTWSGGINIFHQDENKMYSNNVSVMDSYFETYASDNKKTGKHFGNPKELKYAPLKSYRMIYRFAEDRFGNIWIATVEEGLVCFNPETGKVKNFKNNPNDPYSICDNNLMSVYVDYSGLVWVGSLSSGVSIFNPYTFRFGHYKANTADPDALPNSQVWSLHYGKKTGKLYIGVMGSVRVFDTESNRFVNYVVNEKGENLLHTQSICQALQEDANGNLWISVNGSAMFLYDPVKKSMENFHPDKGEGHPRHHTIISMDMNLKGEIYMSLIFRGMDKYNPVTGKFEYFVYDENEKSLLTSEDIRHLKFDNEENLWIATDSGINILQQNGEMKYFFYDEKIREGLPSNDVISIYHDKNNDTWVGTAAGLCRFDKSAHTFENYTDKYKIGEDGVMGITEDKSGNLWLVEKRGVTKFNLSNYTSHKYDFTDGLQSNEVPYNTILSLDNGYILIGGNKGLNYFDPEELMVNTTVPGVVITNILLRDKKLETEKDVTFTDEITLDYDHYFFTIEFASLDFVNTAKNRYKYKLVGFNDEWVSLGNKSQVTFVNLDPGEYTFIVAGSNNDGVWNERGASIKIIITPPFWQTTWFYILCGIVIVVSGYSWIKYRERKLVKEKQILEGKVSQRTKELREEKEKVEEAHKEITDSINYAKTIQEALLPSEKEFHKIFSDSFVLFRPKNIVSGDFFWIEKVQPAAVVGSGSSEQVVLFAVADCTGHGVPGGFMSMLGTSFLKEIVNEKKITDPAEILNQLREKVIDALKQRGVEGENKDGMDISLGKLEVSDNEKFKFSWSGANNPLWLVMNDERRVISLMQENQDNSSLVNNYSSLLEVKPDKMPIGYYFNQKPFTPHTIELQKGDCIYIFSDGFADQFGGEKGKKFKYKPMQEILVNNAQLPMKDQYRLLQSALNTWMGDLEQNDDITVIGIRI